MPGLTVRPEPVEGWTVKPFMVRQAHYERLNLKLSRLKLEAKKHKADKIAVSAPPYQHRTLIGPVSNR